MTASQPALPRRSFRESLAELKSHQKAKRGVSVYSIYVNRPIGSRLAVVADTLGLTPNAVTLLSGIVSLVAVALVAFVPPTIESGVVIAFLLALGFALDSADGQLARLQGHSSTAGEFLDHMTDLVVKMLLHGAVLVAWFRLGVTGSELLIPLGFQLVAVMLFFGATLAGKLVVRGEGQSEPTKYRPWILLPADHGAICLSFLVWGWQSAFLVVYLVLFAATTLVLGALSRQWMRVLS